MFIMFNHYTYVYYNFMITLMFILINHFIMFLLSQVLWPEDGKDSILRMLVRHSRWEHNRQDTVDGKKSTGTQLTETQHMLTSAPTTPTNMTTDVRPLPSTIKLFHSPIFQERFIGPYYSWIDVLSEVRRPLY